MMIDNWRQIAGIAGILFVVLFIIGVFIPGDTPMYNDSGEEIAAWFADNSESYLLGDFITGLAFTLFYLPFLNGLYAALRLAEGEPPFWSRVALTAGILFPV